MNLVKKLPVLRDTTNLCKILEIEPKAILDKEGIVLNLFKLPIMVLL